MLMPLTWRGGKFGGTPTIIDFLPCRARWSQIAKALMDVELAKRKCS